MITKKIIKNQLCVGCGLCSSVLDSENCNMVLSKEGFYRPHIKEDIDDSIVKKICPGIRVHSEKNSDSIWGNVLDVCEGWSSDERIRHKAASGGVVTALALYLIERKIVDAVLQVGVKEDSYLYNELKISRSRNDVINCAQSRYAPSLTLNKIKQIIDKSNETFAFVGKPCDIAGVKNFIDVYPHYKERFRLFISIFCAGMPSYNATKKVWTLSGKKEEPISLKYRGDGWPGYFKAVWKDGSEYQLSYNNSWGKILGRHLGFRCKICPDGIGMLSDISVGDSWSTKNGYPEFAEQDGRCFVLVRTERGRLAMNAAEKAGYLVKQKLKIDRIKDMQPYQYQRRRTVGWRIFPVQAITLGLLNIKGFRYNRLMLKSNFKEGIKTILGTLSRFLKARTNTNI